MQKFYTTLLALALSLSIVHAQMSALSFIDLISLKFYCSVGGFFSSLDTVKCQIGGGSAYNTYITNQNKTVTQVVTPPPTVVETRVIERVIEKPITNTLTRYITQYIPSSSPSTPTPSLTPTPSVLSPIQAQYNGQYIQASGASYITGADGRLVPISNVGYLNSSRIDVPSIQGGTLAQGAISGSSFSGGSVSNSILNNTVVQGTLTDGQSSTGLSRQILRTTGSTTYWDTIADVATGTLQGSMLIWNASNSKWIESTSIISSATSTIFGSSGGPIMIFRSLADFATATGRT